MKKPIYILGLLLALLSCQHKDVAPDGYLKPLALFLEPRADGVSLTWSPAFHFEEGMYGGSGGSAPIQPAQYEVYISETDEKSLQKVAVIDGSVQTYVLRNQPAGKTIYAKVKAVHPGLATTESPVVTTNTGQLGTTSLLFPDNPPAIIFGSWSGSTLLYSGWNDVWTIRKADGMLRTLKNLGSQPVLSPDGRTVAYLANRNNNTSYSTQLFIETVESATVQLIDTQPAIFCAEWSHDGQWLAYVTNGEIWKVAIADGKRSLINRGTWNANQSQIAWSPDDQAILVTQERTIPVVNRYVANLLRVPVNGGEPQSFLVSDWRDEQPAFSPDGQQLAFFSHRSGYRAIWVMNRSTGMLRQLTGGSEQFYYINRLDWMDNKQLTYTAQSTAVADVTLKKVTLP